MANIKVIKGDITTLTVDAIVNAANSTLLGGGGVDGAIHRAGGPAILKECREINRERGGCETGDAVITTAGDLPARKVIHTVGPIWRGGDQGEADLLRSCYLSSLQLAVDNELSTIAFPNISTGVYGFPKIAASRIAVKAVKDFLKENNFLTEVIFVCFDDVNYELYQEAL
jgi:O-acetyl-ADP-ribose deacetylase (regulator of RNase III)